MHEYRQDTKNTRCPQNAFAPPLENHYTRNSQHLHLCKQTRNILTMSDRDFWLACDDRQLVDDCDVAAYKASGPGGQHRNKVSSAIRLTHRPSGIVAHGNESRSQHDNKRIAIKRLRMHIACQMRTDYSPNGEIPTSLRECMFVPKQQKAKKPPADQREKTGTEPTLRDSLMKLKVGKRDRRYWPVAAIVLDVFDACQGALADTAANIQISTGNLSSFFKSERHLFTAAQTIRKQHNQKPLH